MFHGSPCYVILLILNCNCSGGCDTWMCVCMFHGWPCAQPAIVLDTRRELYHLRNTQGNKEIKYALLFIIWKVWLAAIFTDIIFCCGLWHQFAGRQWSKAFFRANFSMLIVNEISKVLKFSFVCKAHPFLNSTWLKKIWNCKKPHYVLIS